MATLRLPMRKAREILRQKLQLGRSHREVAKSVGVSLSWFSVNETVGLDWLLRDVPGEGQVDHHAGDDATVLAACNVASSPSSRRVRPRAAHGLRVAPGALLHSAARGGLRVSWAMGDGCLRRGLRVPDGGGGCQAAANRAAARR